MLLLGSFHHTSAFLASWSKAAGDGLFFPQNWEYIQKTPGSPHHISTVTPAQPESDACALPPTPCAEPNADFTIVSVPVSPSRWLLWGCDPALTGLRAACRLGRIAAGAVPTMAGWCQGLAGTNRDPVFQGYWGLCKAWTVQIVQKWGQQRALRYHRSPSGQSPRMGNGATPKVLQPFSALPWA